METLVTSAWILFNSWHIAQCASKCSSLLPEQCATFNLLKLDEHKRHTVLQPVTKHNETRGCKPTTLKIILENFLWKIKEF